MTDQERDAAAAEGAEDAEDVAEDEELDEADELEDDEDEGEDEDEELAPAVAPAPGRPGGVPTAPGGRRLRGQPRVAAAPTVSERAVHVNDRFSGWYVMAVIGVFVLILANAILFGHAGFVTGLFPSPTPIVAQSPSVIPSAAAPVASAAPSASSAASGSAAPSSSASAGASAPASSAPASASPSAS